MIDFIDARASKAASDAPTGEQVKALREKLGWSQSVLADNMSKAGLPISQSEISLIERGGESQPVKAGYKETHDPTRPKFLGRGYHGYRDRLRLFFLRHGVIFIDQDRVLISDIKALYEPFISALGVLDFGSKPETDDDISVRRKEFDALAGAALSEAARWTVSKAFVDAREAYATGENTISWNLESFGE